MEVVPIQVAIAPAAGPGIYVPFWRFRFNIKTATETFSNLEEWSGRFRLARAFAPKGDHVFVPAMPWLGFAAADIAFAQACRSVHFDPPTFGDATPVSPEQTPTFFPFRLDADAARSLGRTALLTLFESGPAARLTATQMDRLLLKAGLELDEPTACYIPFSQKGNGAERGRFTLSPLSLAPVNELGRPSLSRFKPRFNSKIPLWAWSFEHDDEAPRGGAAPTAAGTPQSSEPQSRQAPRRRS